MRIYWICIGFIFLTGCVAHRDIEVSVPESTIGFAWAQNSINAVIFRKNAVVSHGDHQYVAYYDADGSVILAKRNLKDNVWQTHKTQYRGDVADAHRSISIMIDGAGYLHMSWDHHDTRLRYVRSIGPGGLELSEEQQMVGDREEHVSYPEFYKLPDGDLFFLYRDGGSGRGDLIINRYDTESQQWTRVQNKLIDGEEERSAYWQAAVDDDGHLHLSWVWRETWDVSTNHDMCYAVSRDGGVSWVRSDGTAYSLPITVESAEVIMIIPQQSELINQTSMYVSEGKPYIATYYRKSGDISPQYYLIHQDERGWSEYRMTYRQTPFSLSGGGTKRIPISRPQIVVDRTGQITMISRDAEYNDQIVITKNIDKSYHKWESNALSVGRVDSWEPCYDTELWRDRESLHIYVQRVGQGDGETLEQMPPQPVRIIEVKNQKE